MPFRVCKQIGNGFVAMEHRVTSFPEFLESLRDTKSSHFSPERMAAALGIRVTTFARMLGIPRTALRNPSSKRVQVKLREIIEVISSASVLTDDVSKAIYWCRNAPIADYGHRTATELVAAGHGDAVLAHLRDLENGFTR